MIRNYLKIAFRNLFKHKTYSFINILGLTLGLVCFLLIALYVFDELTYDSFHQNADHTYRVIANKTTKDGKDSKVAATSFQIAEQSALHIPEIKMATHFSAFGRANVSDPNSTNTFYETMFFGNKNLLKVFDFNLLEGDRNTALSAPQSVIITEDMAKKLFGVSSVLGRTISIDIDSLPYKITGILQNFPVNSSLSFNLLLSESSLSGQEYDQFIASDWSSNTYPTYFVLDKNASVQSAADKINKLYAANRPPNETDKLSFSLQPLKDMHFHSEGIEAGPGERRGNMSYIYVFSVVALFVLLIACINYINLTTARFSNRSKEIAVRKVAGAGRANLIGQFLAEAFVVAGIALVLALGLVKLILPAFNSFAEKKVSLDSHTDYRVWMGVGLTILVVGLFAGIYPAFFQSRFKPLTLLKSKIVQSKGQLSLRQGLVIFQFSLSIIMIVATIVVFLQMRYVNTADMGFNKDQLLVVDINSGKVRRHADMIKAEYAKIADVKSVSVTSRVPGEWKVIPKVKARSRGSNAPNEDLFYMAADESFLSTFQVKLLKGRNFTSSAADSSAILINMAAAKALGIQEPSEQMIEIPSIDFSGNVSMLDNPVVARVVGIVDDFNYRSLREKVSPMIIAYRNNPIHNIDYFTVRLNTAKPELALKQMEAILHNVDANHLFEYNFLSKQWDNFYRDDRKRQTIFLCVAIMTILIACLGLFGLATYAAEQRVKEIGIRKVLGASIQSIVAMLSMDFLRLVAVAALISIPVSWWMMNSWLSDFAYRTKIYWWVFAMAGAAAFVIAFCTVSVKAIRAAVSNPVTALRNE